MTLVTFNRPNKSIINKSMGLFDEFVTDLFNRDFAGHVPAVNVAEVENGYTIDVSAPGFSKEDFKLQIEEGVLTISGEHKTETEKETKNYTRKEFNYGSFKRSFTLPESVNIDNINAKYENGILKLSLAKKQEEINKASKEIKIA